MFTCFSALLYICCAEMEPVNVVLVVPQIEKRPEEIGRKVGFFGIFLFLFVIFFNVHFWPWPLLYVQFNSEKNDDSFELSTNGIRLSTPNMWPC